MSKRYVRIKEVRGQGFRTFANKFKVCFPQTGTMLIEGQNIVTGGSSGAGKSNLFLAIAYVLGYCPYPGTVLQSWYSSSPMWVEIILDTHEGEVVLRRGSKLTMSVAGVQVTGGAKGVTERLRQLLGLDIDMLAALTYRGQRKPGLFLRKTDSEKKEFLTTILGLDLFEAEAEKASNKARELKEKVDTKKASLLYLQEQVMKAAGRLKTPEDVAGLTRTREMCSTAIEGATEGIAIRNAEIEQLKQRQAAAAAAAYSQELSKASIFEIQISELESQRFPEPERSEEQMKTAELAGEAERRLSQLKADDGNRARELRAKYEALDAEREKLGACFSLIPVVQEKIDDLKAKNAKLDTGFCPTCQQAWDKYYSLKQANQEQIAQFEAKLAKLGEDKAKYKQLYDQLREFQEFTPNPLIEKMTAAQQQLKIKYSMLEQQRYSKVRELMAARDAQIADLKLKISQVQVSAIQMKMARSADFDLEIAERRNQITTLNEGLASAQRNLTRVAAELSEHEANTRIYNQLLADYKKAEAEFAPLEQQMLAEQEFSKLVGREGFLGLIFEEILAEIADETNKILGSVANTQHVSISFRSENVTAKGTTKREIKPVLQVGDQEAVVFLSEGIPDCAGVSGGMISAIELAVDLAVGRVISQRSAFEPGWLILDESFNGLDAPSMETCMSILQEYGQNRLVLVIDHASEFKAQFSQSITIAYDGKDSTILAG